MKSIEKLLENEKKNIDTIHTPLDIEERLSNALLRAEKPKRSTKVWKWATVAALMFLLMGYNFNAVAYYGKKLIGFDEILTGTLKDLNELGMGQIIEEHYTLSDGTELTINGIMSDANRLILYYTLNNENGIDDGFETFRPQLLTGIFTQSLGYAGAGIASKDQKEYKGEMEFDSVSPFAKTLTLHYWHEFNNELVKGKIKIPYNPNKAMMAEVKQKINKTISVDKGSIRFKTISATPTATVISGTLDISNFDRTHLGFDGVKLVANGEPIQVLGSGHSSALSGTEFEIRYDSLPEELESLQLIIENFIGYRELEEKISLAEKKSSYKLSESVLNIKDVRKTADRVEVTISTDSSVLLDNVYLDAENQEIPLLTTVGHQEIKQTDGSFLTERTLLFDTNLDPQHLLIGGMHYSKKYDIKIDIPIE